MIEVYSTKNLRVHEKVIILLKRQLGAWSDVSITANGKPYIEGNPVYFSITHSLNGALIAICDRAVGVDMEFPENIAKFRHILMRFTRNEQDEIGADPLRFAANWTVKEAYIKMKGGTLAHDLKRLEYYKNRLFVDGKEAACGYVTHTDPNFGGLYAICAEGYSAAELAKVQTEPFSLRTGEKFDT